MVKNMVKTIFIIVAAVFLLILIMWGIFAWEAYKYADCLKVGHSNGYCFGRMLE